MKSHIKVLYFQCMVQDEISLFFNIAAHQNTKEPVGLSGIIQLDLQQCSRSGIYRCIPSRAVLSESSEVLLVKEIIIKVERLSAPNRPQYDGQHINILTQQQDSQLGGFFRKNPE